MADFTQELNKIMAQFGGYATGIENIEGVKADTLQQFREGGERAGEADLFGLKRAGMGQSVVSGLVGGTRQAGAERDAARAILQLLMQHNTLKGNQRLQILGQMAPIAYEESQKPGWFAQLAGGALNLAGKVAPMFMPPSALDKVLMSMLSSSSAGGGGYTGTGGYNPQGTNMALDQLGLNLR